LGLKMGLQTKGEKDTYFHYLRKPELQSRRQFSRVPISERVAGNTARNTTRGYLGASLKMRSGCHGNCKRRAQHDRSHSSCPVLPYPEPVESNHRPVAHVGNIILCLWSDFLRDFFHLRFMNNILYVFYFPCACYVSHPSHPSGNEYKFGCSWYC
jgi:hypothetical protein